MDYEASPRRLSSLTSAALRPRLLVKYTLREVFGLHKRASTLWFINMMQLWTHVGRRWKWARPPIALCVLISGWCTAEYCKRRRRQNVWTKIIKAIWTQSKHTCTHTCPSLSCRHCSVNPSTCPRTQRLWAACTGRTRLQSYQSTKSIFLQQHSGTNMSS